MSGTNQNLKAPNGGVLVMRPADPDDFELGTLKHSVKGRLFTWRKGTRVNVHQYDGFIGIERLHPRNPDLPCLNKMVDVPRSAIRFDSPGKAASVYSGTEGSVVQKS